MIATAVTYMWYKHHEIVLYTQTIRQRMDTLHIGYSPENLLYIYHHYENRMISQHTCQQTTNFKYGFNCLDAYRIPDFDLYIFDIQSRISW
jgi:hypothetical protein